MRCRISEDVYQFTLLFFVPDVVYLFICPLLFYVRGCLSVHCPLKPNVWWCLHVHLPTTAVFHRESTCPFFYHFCMLQVVCLPVYLFSTTVCQRVSAFPFALYSCTSDYVNLSICNLLSVWWCLPFHLSSNCMSVHGCVGPCPLPSTAEDVYLSICPSLLCN